MVLGSSPVTVTYDQLIFIYYIVIKLQSRDAIYQLERNEWSLLSAFQQGLWQKLSWFLS